LSNFHRIEPLYFHLGIVVVQVHFVTIELSALLMHTYSALNLRMIELAVMTMMKTHFHSPPALDSSLTFHLGIVLAQMTIMETRLPQKAH